MHSSNKPTYHRRLFIWLVSYSLILMVSFVAYQAYREQQFKASLLDARLQVVNSYVLAELAQGRAVDLSQIGEMTPIDDLRISVISPDGKVVYDNTLDSLPNTNHLGREEIAAALRSGHGYALRRHSVSTGNTYFYSAMRGDSGIVVRTAVPYTISLNGLLRPDYGFLWMMCGVTIVMCILGFFATRKLGRHVSRLHKFIHDVERGATISSPDAVASDELGDITNHIVRLYARLQQAHINCDIEHRRALYEQQEKERIKKQLTNNINHELKTPVASIQVCIETLLEHPELSEQKRREFLERCAGNVNRLNRLLTDVSMVTRIDDGSATIRKEPVDVAAVIDAECQDLAAIAAERGMTIANNVDDRVRISGNEQLLASIFHNLIHNAIMYSGGTKVEIRAVRINDDTYSFTVSDNGAGVSPEHLPRLFERFYRVDKGRSRAAGGTGLGLAIVKNAVIFHGGSISVENLRTGGLRFRFSIKVS